MKLDTSQIVKLLDEAAEIAEKINGADLDDAQGTVKKNPAAGETSRDLLRAANLCDVARAELENLQWRMKGYPDPREGPAE